MTRGFPPPHLGSLAYRMSKNESNKQKRFLAQHQLPRKDPFEAGPAAMWRKFVFQLAPELCFKRIVFHFFRNLAAKLVPDTRIDIWCVCVCVCKQHLRRSTCVECRHRARELWRSRGPMCRRLKIKETHGQNIARRVVLFLLPIKNKNGQSLRRRVRCVEIWSVQ